MKATDSTRFSLEELDVMSLFLEEFYPEFLDFISDSGLDQDFAERLLAKLACACIRSE
jgi:hypothetical protein